ncbi:LamG-like jellyroll fold domain-containing protein [Arachidicoccus sp.]|uniref:LamG-like jellyroll fold domain-containing protein n=1 Tax=Arachidicoccus sp. TaxID=1872624 RepID=UPI003D239D22
MNLQSIKIRWIWLLIIAVMVTQSCKKFADPAPIFENYGNDSTGAKTRKVLIIGIDGFSGADLEAVKPTFLNSLLEHSKYTFSLLKEGVNNDVSGWKSVATGTSYATHLTSDSSFSPIGDQNDPDGALPDPNNIFYYLIRYKPLDKSLLITPWGNLANLLLRGANKTVVALDDKEVRDSAASLLTNTNPDLSILDFNEIAVAGKQYGFGVNNAQYKAAIQNVDGYIQDVMKAIKARKTYNKESWLIMIASNKGPDGLNPNQGFLMAYNDNLTKEEVLPNGDYTPMYSTASASSSTPTASAADYDIQPTTEMTISFKLLVQQYGSLNPGIILKTASSANSNQGWWFCHNGSNGSIRFVVRGTGGTHSGTNNTITSTAGYQELNVWHSYTGKIYIAGGKRYMQLYIDGAPSDNAPIDITNLNCTTTSPLRVGIPGSYNSGTTKETVTDLRIYNVALPDDVIAQNACKMYLDEDRDAYYSHLIGYWPSNEFTGTKLYNRAPGYSNDLMTMSAVPWGVNPLAGNYLCYTSPYPYDPSKTYSILAQSADVAVNALYWLRLDIKADWDMDGINWINNFEIEYVQ